MFRYFTVLYDYAYPLDQMSGWCCSQYKLKIDYLFISFANFL